MKDVIVKLLTPAGLSADQHESLIEVPREKERGDYAFPCFILAQQMKKNPVQIAQELARTLKLPKQIERVEASGPYLNFFVNRAVFSEITLKEASRSSFGKGNSKGTIVMDYSHPNVAKHFGIHNLRSTLIGHALYSLLTYQGKKVISVNHLGDWGTQFGKLIVAYKKYGTKASLKDIASLNALYVRFHDEAERDPTLEDQARAAFSALERGDKANVALWKKFLAISLKEFNETYKLLGIHFDQIKGESYYRTHLKPLLATLEKKHIVEESEGALVVKFDDISPCIIAKSDEASTYALRDLAAVFERLKEKPESIVYVVDVRQSLHFEQVFRVAEKLGVDRSKLVHVKFGLMKFPDKQMSTRKGNIILFEDLLAKATAELESIIKEKNPTLKQRTKVAQALAIGAIVFHDLQNNRIHDVVFDWKQALSFDGKSGPYLNYTYARARSILRKKKPKKGTFGIITDQEFNLIKKIAEFPDVIEKAAQNYAPHTIAEYSYTLAQTFNEFYHACPVIGSPEESFRLMLVKAFADTLHKALTVLGIPVVEEM